MQTSTRKPYLGISMEGALASWYAKITRKDLAEFQRLARELAKDLPANARVLEIAPGPGFLSIALAKLGAFKVTGLDISQSFVEMASQYAKQEGVPARFIHGSASDIPLEDGMFDLIVCRAAFKNFSEPLKALNEMHRVLKPLGRAVIIDLRKDAPWDEIVAYVDGLHLSAANSMDDQVYLQTYAPQARLHGKANVIAGNAVRFQMLRNRKGTSGHGSPTAAHSTAGGTSGLKGVRFL